MNTRINISLSVLLAAACLLCACESTSIVGPSGRRARMVDEQLQAVLERDFPVGGTRERVRAKAKELGMAAAPGSDATDEKSEEDAFTFSFAPETSWGITRTVRVRYGADGRVERTTLDPMFGAELGPEPVRGWIRLEGP